MDQFVESIDTFSESTWTDFMIMFTDHLNIDLAIESSGVIVGDFVNDLPF